MTFPDHSDWLNTRDPYVQYTHTEQRPQLLEWFDENYHYWWLPIGILKRAPLFMGKKCPTEKAKLREVLKHGNR